MTTKEIAQELFISEKTVRNHISNAMQKLGVKGRSQAVVELLRMGELKLLIKTDFLLRKVGLFLFFL